MNFLENVKIIDCHEHLNYPEDRLEEKSGLLDLMHYIASDMRTAGLTGDLTIEKISEFYPFIMQTGYGKLLGIFSKDLYDIDLSTLNSFYLLDEKIKENSVNVIQINQWYESVFTKCGIKYSLSVDNGKFNKHSVIKPIFYLDFLLREDMMTSATLDEHLVSVDSYILKCMENNMIAGKFATPYWRDLKMSKSSYSEAVNEYLSKKGEAVVGYIFHYILKSFEKISIPIQFHTGHIEPSASQIEKYQLEWSNPKCFNEYATMYPTLKFVLLHTGFPFHNELLTLAKNHNNIYIDFSWIYIISPSKSKEILKVALEMIPNNKIIGFGGDCEHVECAYASLKVAKVVVNEVLSDLVDNQWITKELAYDIANNIFWNNPKKIYNL